MVPSRVGRIVMVAWTNPTVSVHLTKPKPVLSYRGKKQDPLFVEDAHKDMISYEATRYRCPFCSRSWASKYRCLGHIQDGCHKDPRTATCATCRFLSDMSTDFTMSWPECLMGSADFADRRAERPKGCPLWQPKGSDRLEEPT